jgi:hypothetical protein
MEVTPVTFAGQWPMKVIAFWGFFRQLEADGS